MKVYQIHQVDEGRGSLGGQAERPRNLSSVGEAVSGIRTTIAARMGLQRTTLITRMQKTTVPAPAKARVYLLHSAVMAVAVRGLPAK